ncbi:Heat shock transcription factor, partial [Coemansia sp. RSA 2610]
SGYEHTSGHTVASPTHINDGAAGDRSRAASTSSDYRTSISFLTSPSSDTGGDGRSDGRSDSKAGPNSVPVMTLLSPKEQGGAYYGARRNPTSLPPMHIRQAGAQYGEDELTGMAGLMELAEPAKAAHSMDGVRAYDTYSSSTSSNSTASRSATQVPGMLVTPPYTATQYAQYAYAQRHAGPTINTGVLTPESQGMRSFPAMDEAQGARQRSHSTDSMQTHAYGALPCVLGNANIRNRSLTTAQRQRTSDTPLFPVLLHRIITDPANEQWIRWCDDGKAFKFSSADNLLACLQAAGLRAQNYHSVEKNLNDYRFTRLTDQRRKIPDLDGRLWWMFSHPQFLRDHPDGIVNIQRRRRTNPPAVAAAPAHYAQGGDAWM